jgi:hypothetical protein
MGNKTLVRLLATAKKYPLSSILSFERMVLLLC